MIALSHILSFDDPGWRHMKFYLIGGENYFFESLVSQSLNNSSVVTIFVNPFLLRPFRKALSPDHNLHLKYFANAI